jgi:L-lactate dehydrogenase complex protein LldF
MTDVFRTRIRKSLADTNLQFALDANSVRRIMVRKKAFDSLPDAQERRERAHKIRADVVEHLDSYLEQFTAHAQKNGVVVHHATDSSQAIKLVLEIARQHGSKLIAKSKTMVSEEIRLNQALEGEGLEAIETDLGEYIVQLRGEPPSHIITPAVHLRRQDVGKLFEEKLGIDYTEDISVMTNAARRTLRNVFLNADIGISGVNFGVAETGTLCLVTNEGNGRMVTTVPHVHIALMGIERIVPSMSDLGLMLSLLPRSATGQKLSAYTSLINAPRRPEDPDGPAERHIILVDNGRSALQASALQEILYCIRCGSCLNACPVFREIGGHAYVSLDGEISPYPGPVGSVVSPALFGQLEYGHLARASSLCGACREACPVDIDFPKLLLRIRAGIEVNQPATRIRPNAPASLSIGLKLFTFAATSPRRFAAAQWLTGVAGSLARLISGGDGWIHLPKISGWGFSKDFPSPAATSFRVRYRKRATTPVIENSLNEFPAEILTVSPPGEQTAPIRDQKRTDNFRLELEALGGRFTLCLPDEVAEKALQIIRAHGIDQVLAWDASCLPDNLLERLSGEGIHFSYPTSETLESSSQMLVGLTGAYAGLADTGSLVLLGGQGKPMTTSLLPQIHIAILCEVNICENLDQVLTRDEVIMASSAVVITGPSRTSDIEMTLTVGVHGPGELYVICLKDE